MMGFLKFFILLCWFNSSFALTVNPTPVIVQIGQRITLTATDVKGSIRWQAFDGSIAGNGAQVSYIAPNKPGKDVVTVLDDNGPVTVNVVIDPISVKPDFSLENSIFEIFTNRSGINALLKNDGNTLWVGTNGGLEQRNATTGEVQKVYTNLNGLPNNYVYSLLSDGQSGLWVGTDGGLAHLSVAGQWTTFNQSNSGLPSNIVYSLLSDGQGGLWVGTNNGLSRLSTSGQWSTFNNSNSGLPNDQVWTLLSDGQGGLWIGSHFGGLAHLSSSGQWTTFDKRNSGLPDDQVNSLLSDGQGGLWVGTGYTYNIGGLAHLTAAGLWTTFNTNNSDLLNNEVRSLVSDDQGGVWVGMHGVLVHLIASGQWMTYNQSNIERYSYIGSLLSDGQGGLWVGTHDDLSGSGSGLAHLSASGQWTTFDKSNSGLPDNYVSNLLSDGQGGLWVGGGSHYAGGLAHLSATGQWTTFKIRNDNGVTSLLSDGQGGLWVGTDSNGLAHLSALSQWTYFSSFNSDLTSDGIKCLLSDSQGGLWVGTSKGLAHLSSSGQWSSLNNRNSGLSDIDSINSLLSDGQGGLWVGRSHSYYQLGIGLSHISASGQGTTFDKSNSGLPDNYVSSLLSDGNGGLWVGTGQGLAYLSTAGQWTTFNQSNSGLAGNYVSSLLSDGQGGLWVGTYNGLARLSASGQWTTFNQSNSALPDDQVNSLLSDGQSGLWVGTNGGLAHITFTQKNTLCVQQNLSTQQCQDLLLSKRAAILIAGGGKQSDNLLWETTNVISNNLYRTLNKRGFNNDEIFYVSPETDADFNGDGFPDHIVDAPKTDQVVSVDQIKEALDWAKLRSKLDQPLYLFFIDHGSTDKFQLSGNNRMDVSQLKALLDDYQKQTGNEIVIVLDACFSGELGKQLQADKRAVITSTGNSYAYFNRLSYQGFSSFLSKGLNQGRSFTEAFDYAKQEQQKLLDNLDLRVAVTGDGSKTPGLLEQVPYKADQNQAYTLDKLFLNGSFVTGDSTLNVVNKTSTATQTANTPLHLTAEASVAQGKIQQVWAVIRPPRIDLLVDKDNTPILAFPRINLALVPGSTTQWTTDWNDTRYNGQYSITFYTKDSDGEIASSDSTTQITVTHGIEPPTHATTKIQLNQTSYKAGDTLSVQLSEELNWGYDLYIALTLPSGGFITVSDKNQWSTLNQAKRWQGTRINGQVINVLNLTLPALSTGEYCLYSVQSPERQDPLQPTSQRAWQQQQQCFTLTQ